MLRGLYLNVNQNPLLPAPFEPDLDQLIDESPPNFRLAHDLLEFLVQRFDTPAPIDFGVGLGKNNARNGSK